MEEQKELIKVSLNDSPFAAILLKITSSLTEARQFIGLNKEVNFLYHEKFPVHNEHESHISLAKILIGDRLFLNGTFR